MVLTPSTSHTHVYLWNANMGHFKRTSIALFLLLYLPPFLKLLSFPSGAARRTCLPAKNPVWFTVKLSYIQKKKIKPLQNSAANRPVTVFCTPACFWWEQKKTRLFWARLFVLGFWLFFSPRLFFRLFLLSTFFFIWFEWFSFIPFGGGEGGASMAMANQCVWVSPCVFGSGALTA